MPGAILWQRAEGALVFMGALAILAQDWSPLVWWAAILIFFAPDLSFAAYLAGPKVGAAVYNAVHLYGFGLVVMALGWLADQPLITALGFLWLAQAGFDRMLGYGLKLASGFQDTHLGRIGRGG